MKKQSGFTLVEVLAVLITLAGLGIVVGAVFVGAHFIHKFW